MANDLECKMEGALAARLKQHKPLAKLRFRKTSEDSARVNQDCVISFKRGEGNPPYSGIYNLEGTITLTMRHRKTVDTLPLFTGLCKSLEEVIADVHTYILAAELSKCVPDFHCYEIAITGKDDSPVEQKHSCIWTLNAIAMDLSYSDAVALQTQPT